MPDEPAVTFRDAVFDDYPALRRLAATTFAAEVFAFGMYGESPIARFVGMTNQYASWPTLNHTLIVVAEAQGTVLGVAAASLPGSCHLCDAFDSTISIDATHAEKIDHEFLTTCRQAHLESDLPPHAHISTVATEPLLRGDGLGRRTIAALLERLWALDTPCAVLECITDRRAFYERCGFRSVAEFADAGGPGLRSALMRIDLPA